MHEVCILSSYANLVWNSIQWN